MLHGAHDSFEKNFFNSNFIIYLYNNYQNSFNDNNIQSLLGRKTNFLTYSNNYNFNA